MHPQIGPQGWAVDSGWGGGVVVVKLSCKSAVSLCACRDIFYTCNNNKGEKKKKKKDSEVSICEVWPSTERGEPRYSILTH